MPQGATLTKDGERFLQEVYEGIFVQPWWWQAAGRSEQDWTNHLSVINGKCQHVIHDQPIYCHLPLAKAGAEDGVFMCREGHYNWLHGFTWHAFHRDRSCTRPPGHEPHIWLYRHAPNYPDLGITVDFLFRCLGTGADPHAEPVEFEGH